MHRVIAEWLIHVEMFSTHFCFLLFLYVFLGCSVRHTDTYWMYFIWAKFSRPFGGKNVALIAVIHHSRGICFIEKFWARATTVREEPQFIKDTTALSWKFYLWEHCCHTCHWLAACHHNAVQLSIHSRNCRGDVWEPAWLIPSVLHMLWQQRAVAITRELRGFQWEGHREQSLTSVNL